MNIGLYLVAIVMTAVMVVYHMQDGSIVTPDRVYSKFEVNELMREM